MTAPARLRLSRAKGARLREGAVVVARPSRWGNPWAVSGEFWLPELPVSGLFLAPMSAGTAVGRYQNWLEGQRVHAFGLPLQLNPSGRRKTREALAARRAALLAALPELRGRNLACWCAPAAPCHADVLLDLANR